MKTEDLFRGFPSSAYDKEQLDRRRLVKLVPITKNEDRSAAVLVFKDVFTSGYVGACRNVNDLIKFLAVFPNFLVSVKMPIKLTKQIFLGNCPTQLKPLVSFFKMYSSLATRMHFEMSMS